MTRVLRTAAVLCVLVMAAACDDDNPTRPTETVTFAAQLSPANEVPPVSNTEAGGSGTGTIIFSINRDSGGAITSATANFQVSMSNFPVNTALIAAHIHRGAVGVAGDVVVDSGLTPGQVTLANGSGSFSRTGVSVTPALAQEMLSNPAGFYLNVHSVLNPNGVVRGQLVRQ